MPYSRTLFVISFIFNSVYMLIFTGGSLNYRRLAEMDTEGGTRRGSDHFDALRPEPSLGFLALEGR